MVHALLARQLARVGGSPELPPAQAEQWQQLLERISQFYAGAEQERYLLEDASQADAVAVVERIVTCLQAPTQLADRTVVVSGSLGVALSTAFAQERPESLLRKADLAMYQAKAEGKARWALFDPGLEARALERLELESDLRHALAHDQFRLVYQPILSLASRRIVEVEVLLRWQHPVRGLVSPVQFIPLAEETGVIESLGAWVLERACRQARAWQRQYPVRSAAGGWRQSLGAPAAAG